MQDKADKLNSSDKTILQSSFKEKNQIVQSNSKDCVSHNYFWEIDLKENQQIFKADDHLFISIANYYDIETNKKQINKFTKRFSKTIAQASNTSLQLYHCFCGKSFRKPSNLVSHVRQIHKPKVQTLNFMKIKNELSMKSNFPDFEKENKTYIQKIKDYSYLQLKDHFPQQLSESFSISLKEKIKNTSLSLIKSILSLTKSCNGEKTKKDQSKSIKCYFSQRFIEYIRGMLLKYLIDFNRYPQIYFKNISFRDAINFFLFRLVIVMTKCKRNPKDNGLYKLSCYLESFCERFINWIDSNYIQVFQINKIFINYVEIESNQKYSQIQRWKYYQIFIESYKKIINSKSKNEFQAQIELQFLILLQKFLSDLDLNK